MPSSLAESRAFARRSLAGLRAGQGAGPEIHVEPFDRNASTAAGVVKLITSVAAARRHKANYEAQQQDAALARDLIRAQIAEVRARANATTRGPAEKPAQTGRVTSMPITVGDTTYPAGTSAGDIAIKRGLENDRERRGVTGKLAAAKASLTEINRHTERDTAFHVGRHMAALSPYLAAISGSNEPLQQDAIGYFRRQYGIDLTPYARTKTQYPNEVLANQKVAADVIEKAVKARVGSNVAGNYAAQRQPQEDLVRQLSQRQSGIPSDSGGTDPYDVLAPDER